MSLVFRGYNPFILGSYTYLLRYNLIFQHTNFLSFKIQSYILRYKLISIDVQYGTSEGQTKLCSFTQIILPLKRMQPLRTTWQARGKCCCFSSGVLGIDPWHRQSTAEDSHLWRSTRVRHHRVYMQSTVVEHPRGRIVYNSPHVIGKKNTEIKKIKRRMQPSAFISLILHLKWVSFPLYYT